MNFCKRHGCLNYKKDGLDFCHIHEYLQPQPFKEEDRLKVNLEKQLNHPFYKRTDEAREKAKLEALTKAATKYPEPFNPHNWTLEQLFAHGMSENYDQGNYFNGLYEVAVALQDKVIGLEEEVRKLRIKNNVQRDNYAELKDLCIKNFINDEMLTSEEIKTLEILLYKN
jgi:hypothetical protein